MHIYGKKIEKGPFSISILKGYVVSFQFESFVHLENLFLSYWLEMLVMNQCHVLVAAYYWHSAARLLNRIAI